MPCAMAKHGTPYFMNGSFRANTVPPKINRAIETHLMSKFFIMLLYYKIELMYTYSSDKDWS